MGWLLGRCSDISRHQGGQAPIGKAWGRTKVGVEALLWRVVGQELLGYCGECCLWLKWRERTARHQPRWSTRAVGVGPQPHSAHPRVRDRGERRSGARMGSSRAITIGTRSSGFFAMPAVTVGGMLVGTTVRIVSRATEHPTRNTARTTTNGSTWWVLGIRRRSDESKRWSILGGGSSGDVDLFDEVQGADLLKGWEGTQSSCQKSYDRTSIPLSPRRSVSTRVRSPTGSQTR